MVGDNTGTRLGACGLSHAAIEPNGTYIAEVHIKRFAGAMTLAVNDFPVYQQGMNRPVQMVDQHVGENVNTALIGKGNRVRLVVKPFLRRIGERLKVGQANVALSVGEQGVDSAAVCLSGPEVDSAFAVWQEALGPVWTSVLRAEATGTLGSVSAIQAMRDSVAARPFELTATFDNERGPDFSYLFEEAPVIEGTAADSARLKRYALHVRNLIRERDGSGLYEEVRPAVASVAIAEGSEPHPPKQAREIWRRDAAHGMGWFEDADERAGFTLSSIKLQKWSDGRVWEVSRSSGEALFLGWNVFVGYVDGKLHVVRLE